VLNGRVDSVNVAGTNELDKIVASRRKHRQLEGHGVYVGVDVVEHSDGSLSKETILDIGVAQFHSEWNIINGPSPSYSDSGVTNPAGRSGLSDGDRRSEKREYGNK